MKIFKSGDLPGVVQNFFQTTSNWLYVYCLMHGAEYDELIHTLDSYKDQFETVSVAEPLLGEADELAKSPLLKDFKAFSNDHVYCTTQNLYQESVKTGIFIHDLYQMLMEEDEHETFSCLFKLE